MFASLLFLTDLQGVRVKFFSPVWLFATPWTVAHQVHLSMGFSRQEYWSGLPCPSPSYLPNPGVKSMSLMSPALAGGFFTTSATWEALLSHNAGRTRCQFCFFTAVSWPKNKLYQIIYCKPHISPSSLLAMLWIFKSVCLSQTVLAQEEETGDVGVLFPCDHLELTSVH